MSISVLRSAGTTRVVGENEFWDQLGTEGTDEAVFDAQGDDHADIDMRLVEKIDKFLEPKIGDWEESEHWYHKLDFYGDGIRSLSFSWHLFDMTYIGMFQAMLTGEHKPFCILCQLHQDFSSDEDTRIGSIAVFHDKLLVSQGAARKMSLVES